MIDEYKSMGQYYQSSYGNTTLHTNYHYFRFNAFLKNAKDAMKELNSLPGGIEALEAKELAFYKKFGCNSYEEFMDFLRLMMNSDDGKLLRRASNENVSKFINKLIAGKTDNKDMNDFDLNITINTSQAQSKIDEISSALSAAFGQPIDLGITVKGNVTNLKKMVNKLLKKNYHLSSFNTEALSSFLTSDSSLEELVTIEMGGSRVTSSELSQLIRYRPYPWGYTLADIRKGMAENPKQTVAELEQAINDIRKEIRNYFGGSGSSEFNQALEQTLNSVLSSGYNLFFIGSNVRNGLLGAFGEFGTALLINYLYLKSGHILNDSIAEVVGQNLGKQDVQILDAFGIQVKNYSVNAGPNGAFTRRNIEVRQHPNEVAQYFSNAQSFTGFLANFFFNADINKHYYNTIYDLEDVLEKEYTAELLRTAVADIGDTVCFYNISQQYFVPGSRILAFYQGCIENIETKIICNSGIHWTEGPSRGPNEFWKWLGHAWAPTEKNASVFNQLIGNGITIKTTMKGLNIGNYAY